MSDPQAEQARMAILTFAGIVGGGLIAYEAASAVRDGDLLKVEPTPEKAEVGLVAGTVGVVMLGMMYREAAAQVGWKPLILGSVGVFVAAMTARAIRG